MAIAGGSCSRSQWCSRAMRPQGSFYGLLWQAARAAAGGRPPFTCAIRMAEVGQLRSNLACLLCAHLGRSRPPGGRSNADVRRSVAVATQMSAEGGDADSGHFPCPGTSLHGGHCDSQKVRVSQRAQCAQSTGIVARSAAVTANRLRPRTPATDTCRGSTAAGQVHELAEGSECESAGISAVKLIW